MKVQITILLMLIFSIAAFGQRHDGFGMNRKNRGKINELEKIKLIEILEMDEETTLRFFARRNEFRKSAESIMDKRNKMLADFEKMIKNDEIENNSVYETNVSNIIEIEKSLLKNRIEFIESLDDILNKEQIGKFVVFDFRFKRDLRDMIFRGRRNYKK